MKSTIEDEKLKEKLGSNYQEIKDKLEEGAQVLEVENVTKEEYEKAQQDIERFINPIMQKIVQEGGGENMDNTSPPAHQSQYEAEPEPSIEEID